jgi:polyisoprenyl-teichoic acid--peptidoglycan teichoic acid transferase
MKKKKIKNKFNLFFVLFFLAMMFISSLYGLYALSLLSGIENLLRFIVAIFITSMTFIFIFLGRKFLYKNNFFKIVILAMSIIIYSLIIVSVAYTIDNTFGRIKRISSSNVNYSTSIVVLTDSEIDTIDDIDDGKLGMINDKDSIDGYQIPNEVIKEYKLDNELVMFESYIGLIDALIKKEITYAFLPTNYDVLFDNIDEYKNIDEITKIIFTKDKNIKTETSKNSSIDKPFTILLMGVDSDKENIKGSSFNGDALMLITFNPKTLNSTILSIPRDTYVPIACFKNERENKITHAAWYGQDCMIKTIENFIGIEIDYYLKMNFKGVVKLIDALKGIEVDVPYSFCEQDSNRKWGDNTIYVEGGVQTLSGEQTLALARNRHPNPDKCSEKWTDYNSNDFIRGQNQQLIIKSMISKLKDVRSVDTVNKLIDTISNNLETNMSVNEILSLYNIAKSVISISNNMPIEQVFGMQRLYISGYDLYVTDYSLITKQGSKLKLYNYVPYQGSIEDIKRAMEINLGIISIPEMKYFNFSALLPYKEVIIGKNNYSEAKLSLVPDFISKREDLAREWSDKNGIAMEINYITSDNPNHFVGMITKQTALPFMDIRQIGKSGFVIEVVEKLSLEVNQIDCSLTTNRNNEDCIVPSFLNKPVNNLIAWFNLRNLTINITSKEISVDDEDYDLSKAGLVTKQSVFDVSIQTLINKDFTYEFMAK